MSFSLSSALAASTNSVTATFSAAALAITSTNPGDALNPASWVITRSDTGFSYTIASVAQISSTVFQVSTLESFGPYSVTHNIDASAVLSASSAPIVPPSNQDYAGVLSDALLSAQTVAAQRNFVTTDLQNLQVPSGTSQLAGTLVMTAGGDYSTVSGDDLVRKLIIRRLTTPTGGFFHLPDYGIGLRVAMPLPGNDIIKLKAAIVNQCLLEPEVQAASADLNFDVANQILYVSIKARTQAGNTVTVGFDVDSDGQVQL